MTAPVIDATPELAADQPAERPEGTAPIKLVLAVEGIETSDGRYIEPGALSTRPLPLTLYAQVRSTHGADGDAATFTVGSITEAERVPGETITQRSTGEPFPAGTYAWIGKGWMYVDVPTPETGSKPAYTLLKDRALYGNSVDLTEVTAEFEYSDDYAGEPGPPDRIVMTNGKIGSTTLVGIPAFMDAFAEVDDTVVEAPVEVLALVAASMEAAGTTGVAWMSFRSAELGDQCATCATEHPAGEVLQDSSTLDTLRGEDIEPAALDFSTSGMIALIPESPERLAVDGGDPADQLHLTLAYLGDQVTTWDPELIAAVHQIAAEHADKDLFCARLAAEARQRGEDPAVECDQLYTNPGQDGPIIGQAFAHAVLNPNGGPNGQEPATVYLIGGAHHELQYLHDSLCNAVGNAIGDLNFPEQHDPFIPHVTAGYRLDPNALTYSGPVRFDRLRVAIGNQRTDHPLGGGRPVVASAAPLPSVDIFANPNLTEPTPHTVTDDGRVYGHLATWNTCHTGFTGRCITPPESPSSYAYFMIHSTRAVDAAGNTVTIPVGYGTVSRSAEQGGHAGIRLSATEAVQHYDNTGIVCMEFAVGEDDHGIWYAGRLLPGLSEREEHLARGAAFSGDWRPIRGRLELVAALGVVGPGYPVPRVRVASGVPVALVAAAVPRRDTRELAVHPDDRADFAEVLDWVRGQKLAAQQADTAAGLEAIFAGLDLPEIALSEEAADMLLVLDGDHPWFGEIGEFPFDDDAANIGEFAGKLHLPKYIKRIAKHLQEKGMAQGRAIATAVNAAKKMCATGDLNFPGSQQVNPGSRAEACAAVAQWKADRPGAR